VLVSEQSLDFAAAVADRALILEKGEVRWEGSIATLEADEDVRRAWLTV
jgi:branched-chain amino acid transport system ATP-binding protein